MAETSFPRSSESTSQRPWALLRAAVFSTEVALVLVVLLGALLRFHGLGWDQPDGARYPLQMHPDERFLSMVGSSVDWPDSAGEYFNTGASPLNPYNAGIDHYVYGTFPLFLTKAVATIDGKDPAGPSNSYDESVVWGRRITAFTDTLTILLVFGIGAMLFSGRVGLVGALGYAVAVLPTQLAHFFTMDPYVTFFAMATMLASIAAVRARGPGMFWSMGAAAGLALGLGLASKVTAWPILLMPPLAAASRIGIRDFPALGLRWRGNRPDIGGHWTTDFAWLCGVLLFGAAVFRVAMPYAFATPDFSGGVLGVPRGLVSLVEIDPTWKREMLEERDFQAGTTDYPPFVQFADATPFLTPLKNIVLWGLGPALGIAGIAGLLAASVLIFRRRELTFLLPVALAMGVFLFQGPRFVAFMRYFEPMYPVLALFAAWLVVALWQATGTRWRERFPGSGAGFAVAGRRIVVPLGGARARWAVGAIAGITIVTSAWWALAFQNVYFAEHPRIQASEWIYQNVPPGSVITHEEWDDSVPYALPGESPGDYIFVPLAMYQADSVAKIRDLVYGKPDAEGPSGLDQADYIAITSNRVRGSVVNLEREYPATIRYYQLLNSGVLGFERVASFKVEPSFLGLAIDDSSAEEAFTVYDHPEVWIFKKTAAWDPDRAFALLAEAHPERAVNLLPAQGKSNGLQFTAAEAAIQQSGGTFTDVFDPGGATSQLPWLWWFAWLQLMAVASVPMLTWLFRALPDRGYGLSKVAGFAGTGVLTWMLVAWNVFDFGRPAIAVAAGAFVMAGVITAVFRRDDLREEVASHWRAWLTIEAVFFIAFFALVLLRAANPDVWHHPQGGEKPMEMAYLTAVTRSTDMPPFDPWFAGGTMNYYYMGWFLLAVPMRLLRIVPEIGFNLGIATYGALAATVAASTALNLAGLSSRRGSGGDGGAARIPWRPILWVAVLGPIFLVGMGNLDAGHQLIERLQSVNTWSAFDGVRVLGGVAGVAGGLWNWLVHGVSLPPYDWWRSSRVHIGQIDITEFPYWSLLFADLHPHVMDLPIFGLTIAGAVAYVVSAVRGLRAQSLVLAGLLGLLAGLVRTMHTWDFPTAVLLMGSAIVAGQLLRDGRRDLRFWSAAGHLAVAGAMLVVPWTPFTSHFEVFESGVHRAQETTKPQQYFAQFGLFVVIALAFLAVRYREELAARRGNPGNNIGLLCVAGPWELVSLAVFICGIVAFTLLFGVTVIALSVLLLGFLANLLWLEWKSADRDLGRMLATGMFFAAFGIAGGVDVVTVNNDIQRMNTVFKFSLQAWQFFALGSAFAAWYVGRALWEVRGWRPSIRPGRMVAATSATAVIGLLFLVSLSFLWSGTRARQDARFGDTEMTLNGFAFFEHGTFREDLGTSDPSDDVEFALADDLPLVDWLRDNVQGSPVIAEAVGPLYHWTGRMSMLTGLPAVVGWDWHQTQQRWAYTNLIQQRRIDTQQFFVTGDTAFAVDYLRKYNVKYVVVGTEERAFGTPEGLAKFERMDALTEVFREGPYAIYEVSAERLPPLVASR